MKDINTLTVADLTENAPPFTGWRLATEETISAWGQAMKYGDKDVLDLAKKVKHQLDMMVTDQAPRIAAQSPHDRQAAYDYLNEKGVSHIIVSHLVEFSKLQASKQEPKSYAPTGWHMVPRLMTASMINAWSAGTTVTSDEVAYRTHFQDAWKRVLDATPNPDCKEGSNTGYIPDGNHCMACSEPADPNIEELFSRQQAGFERCFEALGITDDRERSWSSLVLAINSALEGRKQDFEFEGWFDKEYPQDDEGNLTKYQETSVMTLMRNAFEAGRDLATSTNRSAIVPLTEPVSIHKALLGGREAKLVTAVGGEVAAFIVNIQLTGWNTPKEHAEGYVRGFNLAAKCMQDALTSRPLGKIPPDGDAEHWKNLYLQEMACRVTWQQKALENMAELTRSFQQWWEDKRDELMQDTNPRHHAEAAWNASAATWARAGKEPVATLHDDGHYTWVGAKKPDGYNYAGWRMSVYSAPVNKEPDCINCGLPTDPSCYCERGRKANAQQRGEA
jgi:hypothetical protein